MLDVVPSVHFEWVKRRKGNRSTSVISEGSSAVVHRATWTERDQDVAIKIFKKGEEREYLKELHIQEVLTEDPSYPHPHLIQVYAKTFFPDRYGLVMEYADGGDLQKWIDNNPRTDNKTLSQAYQFMMDCIRGLVFMHSLGLIHLDLKPGNLLIDSAKRLKICDFNYTKKLSADNEVYKLSYTMGTPLYTPPEQIEAGYTQRYKGEGDNKPYKELEVSCQSDLFCWGLILLVSVSERMRDPHPQYYTRDILYRLKLLNQIPAIPDEIREDTKELILHCLQYRKENRPTSQEAHGRLEEIMRKRLDF